MCHHRDLRPQSGLLGGAEKHGEDKPGREAPFPPGTRERAHSEPSCRTSRLLSGAPSPPTPKAPALTPSPSRERIKPSRSPPRTEKSAHTTPGPQDPKARDQALGSPSKKSAEQPHLGQRWVGLTCSCPPGPELLHHTCSPLCCPSRAQFFSPSSPPPHPHQ